MDATSIQNVSMLPGRNLTYNNSKFTQNLTNFILNDIIMPLLERNIRGKI